MPTATKGADTHPEADNRRTEHGSIPLGYTVILQVRVQKQLVALDVFGVKLVYEY